MTMFWGQSIYVRVPDLEYFQIISDSAFETAFVETLINMFKIVQVYPLKVTSKQ